MNEDITIREFKIRDVFFNNGLVNLKKDLDNNNIPWLYSELTFDKLVLKYPKNKEEECYDKLFKGFVKNNQLVFHTDNDRLYWDIDNNCFIYDKKYDVKGKSSGNDVKNLYKYITPSELEITTEELYNKYLEFAEKNELSKKIINNDTKNFKKGNFFKKENACKIPILMTKTEAAESYMNYLVKEDMLVLDSKIHQFEDGGFCFKDMVDNKNSTISKWDGLIYWYGVRIKRYYNSAYFIYFNSVDLLALYEIKDFFIIKDDPMQIRDEKKDIVKSIPTNIDLKKQLEFDGVHNPNFYISYSAKEFEIKFMMYLCSRIYHLEKMYENTNKERIRKRREKLYKCLQKISFVTYTEDGSNMKSSLEEYTKMYRMIIFMNKLMDKQYKDSSVFKYFAQMITSISMSKIEGEKINLNIKEFAERILKFTDLRKVYYNVSFKILKKDKGSLGSELFEFENIYLKEIERGGYIMDLHSKSKEIGKEIGVFAANLEDKDLLFKLRNIKNHKQMITYFKDLQFMILKKQDKARFSKGFNEVMEELLIIMDEDSECWEVIRDYISIYAIDKYRSVVYAKNNSKGGK